MPHRTSTDNEQAAELRDRTSPAPTRTLIFLRVMAILSLVSLMFQFATAGALVSTPGASPDVHGGGAIVLHVVTGLTTVAAAMHWRKRHTSLWPTVVAALVFVLSFVQAAIGDSGVMWLHVPGALVLTVGAVWVASWSFGRGAKP